MIFPRIFSTNQTLHLEVDSALFKKECFNFLQTKRMSNEYLLMLKPFIQHWIKLLNQNLPPDIHYATLCNSLEEYGGNYIVQKWVEQHSEDLEEELYFVLCSALNKIKYWPPSKNTKQYEYLIALFFRMNLREYIIQTLQKYDIVDDNYIYYIPFEDNIPDHLLLKNMTVNIWQNYLFYLITNGFSTLEIANIIKIPRETFYYEEQQIWQQLKKLWQHPVQ